MPHLGYVRPAMARLRLWRISPDSSQSC